MQSIRRARSPFDYPPARGLVRILWYMILLGLLCALVLLSLVIYLVASSYGSMLHASTKILLFSACFLLLFLCVIGLVGLHRRSRTTILCYASLMWLLVILQVCTLFFYIVWRDAAGQLASSVWANSTPQVRDSIQSELSCCGFRTLTDYPGPTCDVTWTTPCSLAIYNELWARRVAIAITVSFSVLVEIATAAIAVYLVRVLPNNKEKESLDLEEEWLRSLGVEDDEEDQWGDEDASELNGAY